MNDRAFRLREARKKRGFKTARAAADYLNVPYGTYSGHENGSRGIKDDDLIHYARVFKVSTSWLAFGKIEEKFALRAIGRASGPKDENLSTTSFKIEQLDLPSPLDLGDRALVVETDDYAPVIIRGDIVQLGDNGVPRDLLGERVAWRNGSICLLGTILAVTATQTCTLQAFEGSVFLNVRPEWIAPIVTIMNPKTPHRDH